MAHTPRPRFFFSFSHPDDESFAAAGVARHHASAGAEVVLVTATRGEEGKAGEPPICTRDALPACREAELRAAVALLGITDLYLLDYRDRQLAEAPPDEIRRRLVELLRLHRPHIVITFDPNGVNLHPDHVATARFTMDAVLAAADPRWYPESGDAHRVQRLLWTSPITPWDAGRSPDLRREPGVDFLIDISAYRHVKEAALRVHRTQHVSIDRCFFEQGDAERILSVEVFRQAWGPVLRAVPGEPGDDVLEGVDVSI